MMAPSPCPAPPPSTRLPGPRCDACRMRCLSGTAHINGALDVPTACALHPGARAITTPALLVPRYLPRLLTHLHTRRGRMRRRRRKEAGTNGDTAEAARRTNTVSTQPTRRHQHGARRRRNVCTAMTQRKGRLRSHTCLLTTVGRHHQRIRKRVQGRAPPRAHGQGEPHRYPRCVLRLRVRISVRVEHQRSREMRMTTAATAAEAHALARADPEQPRRGSSCRRPRPRRTRTAITVSTRRSDRPSLPASTLPAIRPFAKIATRDTWGHQPTFRGKTMQIASLGTVPSAQGMSLA